MLSSGAIGPNKISEVVQTEWLGELMKIGSPSGVSSGLSGLVRDESESSCARVAFERYQLSSSRTDVSCSYLNVAQSEATLQLQNTESCLPGLCDAGT